MCSHFIIIKNLLYNIFSNIMNTDTQQSILSQIPTSLGLEALSEQISESFSIISSKAAAFLQNSELEIHREEFRKKLKQQKKKERKKRNKVEKAIIELKKIAQLKQIMQQIYEEAHCYQQYQYQLKDIGQYILHESTFLRTLNEVIANYVDNSLQVLDRKLEEFLQIEGSGGIMISYQALAEWPPLFKKLTNCLYQKYLDICRAGNDVQMILKELKGNFRVEELQYNYKHLDRDIFKYLIQNHQEFKIFIKYCYRASSIDIKQFMELDEQTIFRVKQILKILGPFMQEDDSSDEQYMDDDSDISTQQEDKKSKKRRNKRRRKNKNSQNTANVCQQIQKQIIPAEQRLATLIQRMEGSDWRVPIELSTQWLMGLRSK